MTRARRYAGAVAANHGGISTRQLFERMVANRDTSNDCPTGDLPGWNFLMAEDFNTDVALGTWVDGTTYNTTLTTFPTNYYNSTNHSRYYSPKVLYVKNSSLYKYLHTEDVGNGDEALTAMVSPIIHPGQSSPDDRDQLYGRYAIRWKIWGAAEYYKIAWLLWNGGVDGEIDYPELNLYNNPVIGGFMHWVDSTGQSQYTSAVAAIGAWHTTVVEWYNDAGTRTLKFYVDGTLGVTYTGNHVNNIAAHWNIQTEAALGAAPVPYKGVIGIIQIDWVAAWEPA